MLETQSKNVKLDRVPKIMAPVFPDPSSYDPRFTSEIAYEHLRKLITMGFLPPGTEVKQQALARKLGISRTPLREAFRRLQAEGLLTAEVNQRMTVSALDVTEIDALYGARIVLETFGMQLSTGRLSKQNKAVAEKSLAAMWRASIKGNLQVWTAAHLDFHMALVAPAGSYACKSIFSLASECDRFLFVYHAIRPLAPQTRHREHEALLHATLGNDPNLAARLIARHLAITAVDLIHDLDPDRVTTGVQAGLDQVGAGSEPLTFM